MPHEHTDFAPAQSAAPLPGQRVVKLRRDYNSWVASETMEDYALRFAPHGYRRWTHARVANTALGAASFLVLEAVGATLLMQYGFSNALWAILATGLLIFLAGLPISAYAARYGVDMDLLTRGAGFGYIGSTITSLIYATFTFIFFALEAAIMAYALELVLDIPPAWGYLICSLAVIPLVTHGVSAISRLQLITQPLWLLLWLLPFGFVLWREPTAFAGLTHYAGESGQSAGWEVHRFGAALTVGIALITQMGEQADYLRFMPERQQGMDRRWWLAVLVGGTGWIVLGVIKMLGGAALAYLAVTHSVPADRAVDPNQMYLVAYEYVFSSYGWAVAVTALFVVVSQLKINVTNAYAGSLAWSNFFSRLTHSHPGRVVWVGFNGLIALMLMEMDVFSALGEVLGLYSNIAIAWIAAVVADLVINKPLGLSPAGIEFKRARLYDINPVGVGAMLLASLLSVAAYFGLFGDLAQSFSALVALVTALVSAPAIAWATRGRYYLIAQPDVQAACANCHASCASAATCAGPTTPPAVLSRRCVICEHEYEMPDMAHCPAYGGSICSLCCTLDARCEDACKPQGNLGAQWKSALRRLTPPSAWPLLERGLGHFLLIMGVTLPLLATMLLLVYRQEASSVAELPDIEPVVAAVLRSGLVKVAAVLLLLFGVVAWWLVLAAKSRKVAQQESNRQTELLMREIARHQETDRALQEARRSADEARLQAEQANQAKSRYISAISHELRTPLNSILGYSQLMAQDASVPEHRQQALRVIQRGGEHLLSLIEGTLDIAHIESGKLTLQPRPMRFVDAMQDMASMFELQAHEKGLYFRYEVQGQLPAWVRADDKRLRQIFFNLLGNAIKFTRTGGVTLRVRHALEMAHVEIEDTGPGLKADEVQRVFEPFARGQSAYAGDGQPGGAAAPGAGLGLTIAKMLTDLMGGEMTVRSEPGLGACFQVRLFLPALHGANVPAQTATSRPPVGYDGAPRELMIVDNEAADRHLLVQLLHPLGFALREAASGHDALDLLASGYQPDAVLLDLAMPGIDGWETLRRLRAMAGKQPAVAIVSANAFEVHAVPPQGIASDDFITKPVRHRDLLDWLQRRLQLQWRYEPTGIANAAATPPPASAAAADMHGLPHAVALELQQLCGLGYYRGITNLLDGLDRTHPELAGAVQELRALARAFQFDAIVHRLAPTLHNPSTHA